VYNNGEVADNMDDFTNSWQVEDTCRDIPTHENRCDRDQEYNAYVEQHCTRILNDVIGFGRLTFSYYNNILTGITKIIHNIILLYIDLL
jgi:hypothetical protein